MTASGKLKELALMLMPVTLKEETPPVGRTRPWGENQRKTRGSPDGANDE